MRRIGVSCTGFCTERFESILDMVSGEFAHFEIFSEVEHAVQDIDPDVLESYAGLGMTFSIHTSIANTDLGALNPRMRDATVCEMISEMECAAEFGIDTMTVHPGLTSLSVPGCRERCIAAANDSCRRIEAAAVDLGISNVCVENMPDVPVMLGTTADELGRIVDGTDLGITFDIGHAHTMCQIDEMIDTFGDRIRHIHIHDNNGCKDEHLTIGDGNIDFGHVVSRLQQYAGLWIIEAKSFESAVESQKRLKQIFGERLVPVPPVQEP